MTKLSRALEDNGLDETMNCRDLEAIETAARLDIAEAYRRGVEDGKSLAYLDKAGEMLEWAHNRVEIANGPLGHYEVKDDPQVWDAANEMKNLRDKAFHGARGIARVEIRQRLERLKEGNGNG